MKTQTNLIVLVCALFCASQASAGIWRVNNNPALVQGNGGFTCNHCFTNLAFALSSVEDGDTLYLEPSPVNYGDINIISPIHIIGPGYFLTENPMLQANPETAKTGDITINVGAEGTTIEGVVIGQLYNQELRIGSLNSVSDITIENCFIYSNIHLGNDSDPMLTNIIISKNYFGSNAGITSLYNDIGVWTNVIIRNNIINGSIDFNTNKSAEVFNNVIYGDLDVDYLTEVYNNIFPESSTSITQNDNSCSNIHHNVFSTSQPLWLGDCDNFWNAPLNIIFPASGTSEELNMPLASCSSCFSGLDIGGENPREMGAFGGVDPYEISGLTYVAIYELFVTPVTSPEGEVTVTVSTRSNN